MTLRNKGLRGEIRLCVCPQVLSEFFAVVTNPRRVAQPVAPEDAIEEMKKYHRSAHILKIYPGNDLLERMIDLLYRYPVTRQEIFDVQLLATMLSNGITRLYTYNTDHFSRFHEVHVLTP
jgi:predicted nucleic acid-binding protein